MLIVRCLETALAELVQIRIATDNGLARYSSVCHSVEGVSCGVFIHGDAKNVRLS